jgi:hypothetical protein
MMFKLRGAIPKNNPLDGITFFGVSKASPS